MEPLPKGLTLSFLSNCRISLFFCDTKVQLYFQFTKLFHIFFLNSASIPHLWHIETRKSGGFTSQFHIGRFFLSFLKIYLIFLKITLKKYRVRYFCVQCGIYRIFTMFFHFTSGINPP